MTTEPKVELICGHAQQPWSDGQVAMWDGSYAGNNIGYSYNTQWLTFTSGLTGKAKLFGEQAFWIGRFRDMYLHHRPF